MPDRWVVEAEFGRDEEEDEKSRAGSISNKNYTSAKTLNDREQRKLKLKLSVFEKEMKSVAHKMDLEQKALRQELETINPDLQKDPNEGFFVPRGTTKEQAQRLREHRRSSTQMSTRSISLKEFDKLRKERSQVARRSFEDGKVGLIPEDKAVIETNIDEVKKRGRRGALFQADLKPVSFTKMAKVNSLETRTNTSRQLQAKPEDAKRPPKKEIPGNSTLRQSRCFDLISSFSLVNVINSPINPVIRSRGSETFLR